jgi:hypothetical protein
MEIQLDKQTEHGYEVLNPTVFNHLLRASIPMGATHEITDDPEKVCINSTLFPKKGIKYVFSKYEELVPKFIKTKANVLREERQVVRFYFEMLLIKVLFFMRKSY